MTTNISRRQPMAMPWTTRDYSFDPDHFRALFPESVVARMERAGEPDGTTEADWLSAVRRAQQRPLLPFPSRADLPVLVAVRMSLSFPGLIAAVPLHAVDYSLPPTRRPSTGSDSGASSTRTPRRRKVQQPCPRLAHQRNWFSDGGICANLPLQFFDSALPRRPTFAINLAPFPRRPQEVVRRGRQQLPADAQRRRSRSAGNRC